MSGARCVAAGGRGQRRADMKSAPTSTLVWQRRQHESRRRLTAHILCAPSPLPLSQREKGLISEVGGNW